MRRLALEEEAEPWKGGPSGPAAFANALSRASCRPLPNPRVPPGRPRNLPPAIALEALLAQQLANADAPLIEAPVAHAIVLGAAASAASNTVKRSNNNINKSSSPGAIGGSSSPLEGPASAAVLKVVAASNTSVNDEGGPLTPSSTAAQREVGAGVKGAAGAVTACAPIAFDATTSTLRASKLKAEANADVDEDATRPEVVYPELLLAGAGDRSELAGWLPEVRHLAPLLLHLCRCSNHAPRPIVNPSFSFVLT